MRRTPPHPTPPRTTSRRAVLLGLPVAGLVAALLPGTGQAAPGEPQPLPAERTAEVAPAAAGHDVIANLWSWNWTSVAGECTDVLGPAGYAAVWVAPPHESLAEPSGAWWDLYQPFSYQLSGRLGSESDFAAMAQACNDAGVRVYTDAVINHTAAIGGTGYAGTQISDKYQPPMYERADYNVDICDREISNYDDKWEVQNCELLGLPDLSTDDPEVRAEIVGYLNAQIAVGVSGFRVDAAKHMPAADLEAIVGALDSTVDGSAPFVFHEVFPGSTPQPDEYFGSGRVLDFAVGDQLKGAFQSDISQLTGFGSGLLPAGDSVAFVTNHDTERDGRHLTYRDGDTAVLANVFQLAWSEAPPTVYSGFEYAGRDDSPPAGEGGFVTDTDCDNGWYCLNRDPRITGMVGWRNAVAGDGQVGEIQSPQSNVIGFDRGNGFVAINNADQAATVQFVTQLPDGSYDDVLGGGGQATVSGGQLTVELPAKSAVAVQTG
ncbi:alpha-amylase family protein [Streptomyces sp. DSM 44915]|uniref:Alpha-amylase n=1 Tax=Streptomyces chisholmiae TaxID=3075540 RepID=A0ABU2JTG0_9ACTN|nr:alpha-amylase family protein [Streptomyces sp. DSM 44915]MDT0268278.1 alpha-amylase family protein [Streptomyces sp. DSM 44915]